MLLIKSESSEEGFEWDGSYKGQPCNAGIYAYILEARYIIGTGELRSGNITLVK